MTYQYNPHDSLLNDFPNPFRLENLFLLASAFILAVGGAALLWTARTGLATGRLADGAIALVVALMLLGFAVAFLLRALSQLRFFLGRKFPQGLAGELIPGEEGVGDGGYGVMETMRRQSIDFPEPQGPLNGILYSLIRPLAVSPLPLQQAAVRHFHLLVSMAGLAASLIVSWLLFKDSPHEGIISWLYVPIAGLEAARFLASGRTSPDAGQPRSDVAVISLMMGMIAFVSIAPLLLVRFVPPYPVSPAWMVAIVALAGSMGASLLFLLALLSNLDDVPQTAVSCEQTTIAMNCHPAQLWPKVSRDFQETWARGIPNRAYANVPPGKTAIEDADRFQGFILEESQPIVSQNMGFGSFGEALAVKHVRHLVLLLAWGLMLALAACLYGVMKAQSLAGMTAGDVSRMLLVLMMLLASSAASFRISHLLWSRLSFKSRLFWIVLDGTWQAGEIRIGNQFRSNVQSRTKVTKVEDATLRTWVCEVTTVAFGKDSRRYIIAMAPADGMAKSMTERLRDFAAEQSSITAPTSMRDIAKTQAILALDQTVSKSAAPSLEQATRLIRQAGTGALHSE